MTENIMIVQRQNELLKLYERLDQRKKDWISIAIQETNITHKYANIELYQCKNGFLFNDWEINHLYEREPLGHCRLQFPKNAVGVALGVAFAPAYITGNKIDVRLSSTQEGLATLIEESIHDAGLKYAKIVRDEPKAFIQDSLSGKYNALHVFGHDRNIMPWSKAIEESISNNKLGVFASELTGKDFFIIFEDADIDKAARDYVISSTISSGQVCMSPEGAFVHHLVKDRFIEAVQKHASSLVVGNPSNPATDIGPLMSKSVYANANLLVGEARKSKDAKSYPLEMKFTEDHKDFVANMFVPDIIELTDWDQPILREETFCPQFVVIPFKHFDSIISHFDSLEYGLSCSVYGKNMIGVAKDKLNGKIGIIFENQPFFEGFNVHTRGWGGFKKSGWAQYKRSGKLVTEHGPKHLPSLFSKPKGDAKQ